MLATRMYHPCSQQKRTGCGRYHEWGRTVNKANIALCWRSKQIIKKGLKLAPEKTESVLLHERRKLKEVEVMAEGYKVQTKQTVKFLGFVLSPSLTTKRPRENLLDRSRKNSNALVQLMPFKKDQVFHYKNSDISAN